MTPTGFTATFSQPIEIATTPVAIGPNLYGAAASGNLPANVSLIGSNEGTVRGSLVLNSTDTQITFVATTLVKSSGLPIAGVSSPDATSGILAPDGYLVTLDQQQHQLRDHRRATAGRQRQRRRRQQLPAAHGGELLVRRAGGDPLLRPRPEQRDDHQHGQRAQRLRADLLHLADLDRHQRQERGHASRATR